MGSWRAAMWAFAPSHTIRPDSSSLNPRWRNVRTKLPACEMPWATTCVTFPRIGWTRAFVVPFAYRKNDTTSRVAASPMPSTGGSFAV